MSSRVNGVSPRDNPRRHLPHQSAWSRAWFALWVSLGLVFPVPVQALAHEDGVCDRTEEIRDAIVAAVTGVTDCAEITETQLGQITTLTLFGLNIRALAADDLVGLSGLVTLNLAYNRLTALPEMVFDPLTSLDTLWLNNNQLQTLPADVFAGLTGLDDLRLASNPGFPFGPVAEAGPTFFVSTDREVTLQGSGGSDPWGRSVTYAWTQSDSSGVVVPLDGPTTATPGLTAPAVEQETVFRFGLTVTAVNPGGVAPPGTTTAGDSATDWTLVRVQAAVPVSVYFHEAKYVATEGGTAATVEIRLDKIPRRSVSIPLKAIPAGGADAADYSIPPSVTFGYVDRVKYVTVTATDDGVDDDGESLTLGFGDPFPVAVARGSPSSVTVELADNDDPVGVGISGLSVTSDPGTDSVYVSGDALEVTATFSDIVTVSGRPQLALSVGTSITALLGRAERNAGYVRGSGTTKLVFAYGVVAGDNDPDGVSVAAGSLDLNGGSVQDGESADAVLAHDSLAVQPGHRVDALAPTLAEAFVDGSELTLRYSEPLDETSVPPPTAFSVSVEGASRTVSDVGVSGKFVNVTLATAVQPGEEASVGYSLPRTGSIRDKVGLAATAFSNQSATNYTLPTVSIAAVDPNVYEGADVDFELTRNGPNDRSLRATVRVQDSGDVLLGTSGYKNVKFAAGDSTAWLTLKTHDDHGYEAHATVSATAIGGAYHVSETAGTASVTVSDNDVPETDVTLSGPDSVAEEVDTFVVQVSARTVSDEEPHGSLSVRLRSSDGTAKAGSDFTSVRETVRFLPADFTRIEEGGEGRYVATASQAVTILDDSLQEDDETFALELTRSYVIGDNVNLPLEPLVVTIVDTDTPPRPGAVTGLSVTEGDAQLALSWSAVSGATGYKVQWKSGTETFADAATDAREHVISSGTTTARTITGLANGTPYTVRVIATNSAGDGPPSDEKTGTPTAPPPRPGAVTGLSVTEGDAQLALSWSAVSGATGYKVQWKSGTETFADAATDAREHVISSGTTTARTITGLANGTPYTVRVIATNSAGDGPPSDEKTGTPTAPPPRPGAVTGLSVTEGDAQLALSWSAVSGATGYKVQWKSGTETFADAATDAREHVISSGTTTARTITGLANGTPYTVRVIATNSAGDGPPSDEKTGTPTAPPPRPGAVTGLSVTEGDAQLALSWSAVSGATGYKVQWKSGTETFADAATDAREHVISSGTTTARTITGLANGTPYTVRVIATNSAGDGPPSDEKTGTPTAPPPRPGAVTGLSVTEGDAQLALSWSAVSGATGYKVQWKSGTETFADAATDAREHVISSGTTTARTITGLANGTPYTVRVIATNSAGDGPPSDEKTGTPTAPPPRPGAVTGLSVTEGDAQLALSWSAVSGATGYKVQWKSGTETFADAATDAREHVISSGTTTARTITGLANGTPYTVRVIATNSAGDGPPSDEKTGTPTAPPPRPGAVTGLSVTEGDAQLALSWSAVSGATGYKVQWKSGTETFADAATDAREHVISSGTTTARTITGLANGTPYTVRVIATNSAGDGPPSDEKTGTPTAPPPRPGAVTGLSVTEGDAQLALSWSAVSGATGYKVQWKSGTETFADAATDAREHVISSGTTTARTITGLANGTPYTVRVIATNSAGDGPPSDEKTGTPTAPPPRPGAVTGLSVTEGDAQLALSWSAVSGATGYKVQWKSGTETFADAATDAREHVISSGTTTARTITGLANGTPYTVRVIATNSAGDGPPSDEKTGTPTAPPPRPGAVTGLSVTEGDAQLALSWSAVSGATGYKVQWKSGTETFADAATDAREHVISSGTTTARTITGLANGTPYTVRVIATNSAGDGPPSDEKTGTPVATPGLRVTTLAMSLREGDSNTYGVALGSAPAASVTVTVGGWPGTDVEVEPSSLVFTTSNWGASQTVTVTAKQDDHYESTHEVTLTHNSGAGVAGPSLKVTVIDDDGPLPSVSLRALSDSVKEGEVIGFELTRTPPVGGALRGGIFVFDLETGSYSDAMVAFYFQPGDATDRISYRVKIDTLVTTDRTVKAMINPTFDGYEPGSPREATVSVIDQTVNQASGDTAPETGVAFSGAPLAATEGEDITVVVRLSEPAEANVTIPLVVSGLGGANDEDWDVPSEVVIKGGDSLGAVLISAVDDAEEDPGGSLELSFGTLPLGFAAADPRKVVVDIEDNDQFRMGTEETRGWLARFGRAASGEAVEAVRERMGAGLRPSEESRVRVGGHDLSAWRAAMFPVGGRAGVAPAPASGSEVTSSRAGSQARVFFGRLFSGTSFTRTGAFGQDASRRWSVWGRGGVSSFDGRDGALSLSGDLTTVTLGADYGSGRALGGVVLSRSTADGSLAGGDGPGGQVETTLMAAYPWLRYALTDRVSVWGMGGYGAGSMPGSPGDAGAGMDVEMRMGALGAAGQLVSTRALALALSSDALFTRTSAAGATMPGDAGADVSRVRLMLEGSSLIEVAGGTLRPTFEVGFRQDGGDAETGAGLEVGGGFGYSLPSLGLAVEGRVRGLIAHENDGYDEWGASGLVRIAPDPSGRGLNLNLSPSWGSAGPGGARALWSRRNMAGIATRPGGASGVGSGSVVLDLGYGLAVSRQTIVTPYGGTMDGARRLGLRVRTGPSLQIKLENVEGNGHGGLLLNAAYRSGSFLRFAFEARRNTAGEMSLGLTGQVGER